MRDVRFNLQNFLIDHLTLYAFLIVIEKYSNIFLFTFAHWLPYVGMTGGEVRIYLIVCMYHLSNVLGLQKKKICLECGFPPNFAIII